jgi:hypothetical protein
MSESASVRNLRERIGSQTEDRLGKALTELLENPLITGAIGRAFDVRDRASQAQEVAMSALNIPSAADIERLTRRLRSVSNRLEAIEDGIARLDRSLSPAGIDGRLSAIEAQLVNLGQKLEGLAREASGAGAHAAGRPAAAARGGAVGSRRAKGTGPAKRKAPAR